jgi:hypothetical protein
MTDHDQLKLVVALNRLRAVQAELRDVHAGVATLHLEATIAALESHLRRSIKKAA